MAVQFRPEGDSNPPTHAHELDPGVVGVHSELSPQSPLLITHVSIADEEYKKIFR
jgi:hypothetical protein